MIHAMLWLIALVFWIVVGFFVLQLVVAAVAILFAMLGSLGTVATRPSHIRNRPAFVPAERDVTPVLDDEHAAAMRNAALKRVAKTKV